MNNTTNTLFFSPKVAKKYMCEKCDYMCNKKSDFNKHLQTIKHNTTNTTNTTEKYPCECGKKYNHRASLYKQKKKCYIIQETNKNNNTNIETIIKHTPENNELFTEKILETVMSQNKEFMNMFMNKMVEVMPQLGNTTNNNNMNNCHNKTFNINMFLNEHCKNAMNLSDFIESLPITDKTYDNTIKNGLTNTITNMMVDGLNELDILERPIHCTDTKRKTIYVKENDVWEKDKELIKILCGIKKTALNNRMKLDKWQDVNDGWMTRENIQMKYIALVSNVMTIIEDEDKEINKIINAIGKKVYLDE